MSNETILLNFANFDNTARLAFRRVGNATLSTEFRKTDSNTVLKARLLQVYTLSGGDFIVTGSGDSRTVVASGEYGGINIPNLELVYGPRSNFHINADDGNIYTWNTKTFYAGDSAANIQSGQQSLGGSNANVNVSGSSLSQTSATNFMPSATVRDPSNTIITTLTDSNPATTSSFGNYLTIQSTTTRYIKKIRLYVTSVNAPGINVRVVRTFGGALIDTFNLVPANNGTYVEKIFTTPIILEQDQNIVLQNFEQYSCTLGEIQMYETNVPKTTKNTLGNSTLYTSGAVTNGANAFDGNDVTLANVPSAASIGRVFATPTVIDTIFYKKDDNSPIGQTINCTIQASLIGDFSDTVNLQIYSGGTRLLRTNDNRTFVNTTAYRGYRLLNNEGTFIVMNTLEFRSDGIYASVTDFIADYPPGVTISAPTAAGSTATTALVTAGGTSLDVTEFDGGLQDMATTTNQTGVLLDEHDFQNSLNNARLAMSKGTIDTSTFGLKDMTNIAGMRGAIFNVEGFRLGNKGVYQSMMNRMIVDDNTPHMISYTPAGEFIGNEAYLLNTNQNSVEVNAPYNDAVHITGVFNTTDGARKGVCLNTLRQDTYSFTPGYFELSFNAVNGDTQFFVKPDFSVGIPTAFTTLNILGTTDIYAGFKALIEAMPGYAGKTVTATGTLVKTVNSWTGILKLVFSGTEKPISPVTIDANGIYISSTSYSGYFQNNFIFVATTANGSVVDNGHATASGYTAHLHVVGSIGTLASTIIAKIQHSIDGTTWVDLTTFTSIATTGKQRIISTNPNQVVYRYARVQYTILNANRTYAFAAFLSRFGKVR